MGYISGYFNQSASPGRTQSLQWNSGTARIAAWQGDKQRRFSSLGTPLFLSNFVAVLQVVELCGLATGYFQPNRLNRFQELLVQYMRMAEV
ncbi:hypothetical protein Baya_3106 [Bagarius yarrelli]|uniref:Uncharacterized protein n=1 Tax=Bagarius yarrelli TaxID=175774 RepID=A0A556TUG2_BAGYA|nr:hypothetical protein Baya_3106 [Bagarius yarrelli]